MPAKAFEKGKAAVGLQSSLRDYVMRLFLGIDCVIPLNIYLRVVEEVEATHHVRKDEAT